MRCRSEYGLFFPWTIYVACSRVGKPDNLFICTDNGTSKNVVYSQFFTQLKKYMARNDLRARGGGGLGGGEATPPTRCWFAPPQQLVQIYIYAKSGKYTVSLSVVVQQKKVYFDELSWPCLWLFTTKVSIVLQDCHSTTLKLVSTPATLNLLCSSTGPHLQLWRS